MKNKGSWFEPYVLNPHNIEKIVWAGKPAVYVLADLDERQKVRVKHIHMSQNPKEDLKKNLGKFHMFMYKPLKFKLNNYENKQQALQFA